MLMTPGPTALPPSVRESMSQELVNPDVDPEFREIYDGLTEKLARVYDTDDDIVVLGGEGILGLEAAIASTVESGDEVLCLSNGLYGDGFADFVENYGGDPTLVESGYDQPFDLDTLDSVLADGDFEVATMVHCETPTGTLNDVEPALKRLQDHGALTVVDAVSSIGGVPVPTEHVDICLGGSQKCFSAPPGLAPISVSGAAWDRIEAVDPDSLYTNLLPWREVGDMFPYTHLTTLVVALDEALSLIVDEGVESVYARHLEAASWCRERGRELGLEVYPDVERSSPTVTAFHVPGSAQQLQERLDAEQDVTLATGLADLSNEILRVGHMGYNADVKKVDETMDALETVLD